MHCKSAALKKGCPEKGQRQDKQKHKSFHMKNDRGMGECVVSVLSRICSSLFVDANLTTSHFCSFVLFKISRHSEGCCLTVLQKGAL